MKMTNLHNLIAYRRWTNQTELAAQLGTMPDVFSRVIREMTKVGLIEMDKQHIRFLYRTGLAERTMIRGDVKENTNNGSQTLASNQIKTDPSDIMPILLRYFFLCYHV
jgi:hypothetical protein